MIEEPEANVVALPIWGAEELPQRPKAQVFITAGAQSALAAAEYFPSYCCVCGPLAADWSILKGRSVHLWADGGAAGEDRMLALAETLKPIAAKISLHVQGAQPAGWSLAHAKKEGWSQQEVLAFALREDSAHVRQIKASGKKLKADDGAILESEVVDPNLADIKLQRDYRGTPYPTESNALEILAKHAEFKDRLWLDDFAQRLMMDEERFDRDKQGVAALIWMQTNLDMHKLPLTQLARAADYVGRQNAHHPLKEALEAVEWDGAERLPGFMANVYGAERNAYSEAVGRCWLISAIARIYQPGCKADYMLVLEGGQGIHKSTSLSILGGDWFIESHEDPIHNRKDFLGQLQGHWIIEIPEMHSIAGNVNGIEKIKGLISCQVDDYRKPYGATNMTHPRQCVFAGTTNLRQWNSDQTGGRRFWPILCGKIDLDYLRANRDQLLAEALVAYKAGQDWWLVPAEGALEAQEERRRSDPWEPIIAKYQTNFPNKNEDRTISWTPRAKPLEFVQIHRILAEAIDKHQSQWTRADEMRVAGILEVLRYERRQWTVDGKRSRVYVPTVAAPVQLASQAAQDDFDDTPY